MSESIMGHPVCENMKVAVVAVALGRANTKILPNKDEYNLKKVDVSQPVNSQDELTVVLS